MSTMRVYNSMHEGIRNAPTLSEAETNEIMEIQKTLKQLRQKIAVRYKQKAIYTRMIVYYRRTLRTNIKQRNKLSKKLDRYNRPFKTLLQQEREKIRSEMEKQRCRLQYLKQMSQVTKAAIKVYKKERRAFNRRFKTSNILDLSKNKTLKKLKKRVKSTKEKYDAIIEIVDKIKKKLKLVKERKKSLSLKDLKKKLQLNKDRLESLERNRIEEETIIYQVLPDSKMTGFQKKTTVIPASNTQLETYDVPKKSKSEIKRTRRLRKRNSRAFSTDTSTSKTSALKSAIKQNIIKGDAILEPLPIGDKLQDMPKRLANRFTKRFADRTKQSKHSSSPPGDYRTPTTISADSDDTGLELKPKKKRVTLNIENDPLSAFDPKSMINPEGTSSQEEDEQLKWLKMIYDDKYFNKLAGKYGPKIRKELHEERLQKKMELEKLLQEEEGRRKKTMEFTNKRELRASSIDSNGLNQEVKMAMKSTYKMADVIPQNIQIIDEDILQLAGKHKRQTMHDILPEAEKEHERDRILEYLKSIKAIGPIVIGPIRKSKLLTGSRKSWLEVEDDVTEEQMTEEQIWKKKLRKKMVPEKKVLASSLTMSEDTTLNEPMFDDSMYDDYFFSDDFMGRKSRRVPGSSGKKVEGLAYNNNSMYHKFIAQKKNKLPEQQRGSIRSVGSIGKKKSARRSSAFRKDVPEIPKQQQETQPAPVDAAQKNKSSTKAETKPRVSISNVTSLAPRESIVVVAPHQKDGSVGKVKEKIGESLEIESSKEKPSKTGAILKGHLQHLPHFAPKIQVQVNLDQEELPRTTVEEHSPEVQKVEYDENYFQRLFRAHSGIIKKKLHQERLKKLEMQKKLFAQEENERISLEKQRKSLASERAASLDSVAIMQKATASTYKMPDVIPHDIPVIDEHILKLAGRTRRQTMKDVLAEKFDETYSEEYPRKSSVDFESKPKSKRKKSRKSKTKQRTESELSEQIISVINLQSESISQPDDKIYKHASIVDDTEELGTRRFSGKKIEGLAYDRNSMYDKYVDEKNRISLEEKRVSLVVKETPPNIKSRRSTKRKSLEIMPRKRRSRKSIKRRPKKFLVIKTSPIHLKEISQRLSQIRKPAPVALQELYETQSYPTVKSNVRKTRSEPQLEKPDGDVKKSKSLPDVCPRPPEVHVVCSACGMTNLTPGGPCCPLKPKIK